MLSEVSEVQETTSIETELFASPSSFGVDDDGGGCTLKSRLKKIKEWFISKREYVKKRWGANVTEFCAQDTPVKVRRIFVFMVYVHIIISMVRFGIKQSKLDRPTGIPDSRVTQSGKLSIEDYVKSCDAKENGTNNYLQREVQAPYCASRPFCTSYPTRGKPPLIDKCQDFRFFGTGIKKDCPAWISIQKDNDYKPTYSVFLVGKIKKDKGWVGMAMAPNKPIHREKTLTIVCVANGGKDKRGKEIRDEVRIYEMKANHTIETYFKVRDYGRSIKKSQVYVDKDFIYCKFTLHREVRTLDRVYNMMGHDEPGKVFVGLAGHSSTNFVGQHEYEGSSSIRIYPREFLAKNPKYLGTWPTLTQRRENASINAQQKLQPLSLSTNYLFALLAILFGSLSLF